MEIRKRSIPACAGETRPGSDPAPATRVYPRVCGGNRWSMPTSSHTGGLSPRVRGKRAPANVRAMYTRSIPACAGETLRPLVQCREEAVYPRVCGGNSRAEARAAFVRGLSPRVRGKRAPANVRAMYTRSIPACAGETLPSSLRKRPARVYPRVCGGNPAWPRSRGCNDGLSPRVRGKQGANTPQGLTERSIPACAGETAAKRDGGENGGVYPRVCGGNEG